MIGVGLESIGVEEFVEGKFFDGELFIDNKKESYKKLGFKRLGLMGIGGALFSKKSRDANAKVILSLTPRKILIQLISRPKQ